MLECCRSGVRKSVCHSACLKAVGGWVPPVGRCKLARASGNCRLASWTRAPSVALAALSAATWWHHRNHIVAAHASRSPGTSPCQPLPTYESVPVTSAVFVPRCMIAPMGKVAFYLSTCALSCCHGSTVLCYRGVHCCLRPHLAVLRGPLSRLGTVRGCLLREDF